MRVWSQQEQSENRAEFWRLLKSDTSIAAACEVLGVSRRTGRRWILETGGRPPVVRPALSGRYLSIDERIRIADLALAGSSVRKIAAEIGRCPSTVSRELRRNGPGAGRRYGPHAAPKKAETRARRPRALKLDYAELADVVRAKLCKKWSPEQISLHLDAEYPNRCEMRVAHETIYQALFRQHLRAQRKKMRSGTPISTSFAYPRFWESVWSRPQTARSLSTRAASRQQRTDSTDDCRPVRDHLPRCGVAAALFRSH